MGILDDLWSLGRRQQVRRRKVSVSKREDYLAHKEQVRILVHARIAYFNQHYQFIFNRVAIRNQATRWGSCSSAGNLNFNYRLVYLSPELVDYVVVHELCHLYEFNHSPAFWALVAQTIPDWRIHRSELRQVRLI